MDYKKLERWVLDLLEEEKIHKITDIYILTDDIVNAVKDIVEEHQNKVVEQLDRCADDEVMLWASSELDYGEDNRVIIRRTTEIHDYAVKCYVKAIEIVKGEKDEQESKD